MPPGLIKGRLHELYPTLVHLEEAMTKQGSQAALARHLGISVNMLYEHKFELVHGRKYTADHKLACSLTNQELDERINRMFGTKRNQVKTYYLQAN